MNAILMIDDEGNLGTKNHLLYDIPEDKKWFKRHTLGKIVVMGRKTFESLPNQSPLSERTNVVLTRDETFQHDEVIVAHSIEELRANIFLSYDDEDIWFIGGNSIYNYWIPYCDKVYITRLHVKKYSSETVDTIFTAFHPTKTLKKFRDREFIIRSTHHLGSTPFYYVKNGARLKSSAPCDFMVFQQKVM